MDKTIARTVNQFFDQEALKAYVDIRINSVYRSLEDAQDLEEMFQLQGRIKELRQLLKAREYAEAVLKKG